MNAIARIGEKDDGRAWLGSILAAIGLADKDLEVFKAQVLEGLQIIKYGLLSKQDVVDRFFQIAQVAGYIEAHGEAAIQEAMAPFGEVGAKVSQLATPATPARLEVVCMADVRPSAISWLWLNWIALGKVSVLAGEGGRGKSTILCDITARTTTGDQWPDGAPASDVGSVIILAAEDDVEDTLAPRLMAAGADLTRVFVIRSVMEENRRRSFNLQADLERLEAEIRKRDNVKLVIIDPISSYLGKVDSHKNADVRSVLEPIGDMAARLRVAIICNNHFSKGGGNANNRVIGSVAFVNQARAAFIVTPDEDDETRMLLIPSKMNIAPIRHGLAYRIEGCQVSFEGTEIATSRIMYESTPITVTADQALAALDGNGEGKSAKAEASEFLQEVLANGPMSAKDVKREAVEAGISAKSLRTAREELGIKPEKTGFGGEGGWVWNLPKMPS
jgi:putative DNA primase/helicase